MAWLLQSNAVSSEQEAVEVGNAMMHLGLLNHVVCSLRAPPPCIVGLCNVNVGPFNKVAFSAHFPHVMTIYEGCQRKHALGLITRTISTAAAVRGQQEGGARLCCTMKCCRCCTRSAPRTGFGLHGVSVDA